MTQGNEYSYEAFLFHAKEPSFDEVEVFFKKFMYWYGGGVWQQEGPLILFCQSKDKKFKEVKITFTDAEKKERCVRTYLLGTPLVVLQEATAHKFLDLEMFAGGRHKGTPSTPPVKVLPDKAILAAFGSTRFLQEFYLLNAGIQRKERLDLAAVVETLRAVRGCWIGGDFRKYSPASYHRVSRHEFSKSKGTYRGDVEAVIQQILPSELQKRGMSDEELLAKIGM